MIATLKKLRYWHHRRSRGVPHPREVYELGAWDDLCAYIEAKPLEPSEPQGGPRHPGKRYLEMAAYYSVGLTLEEIARHYEVTRERIRQCVYKYCREKRNGKIRIHPRYQSTGGDGQLDN